MSQVFQNFLTGIFEFVVYGFLILFVVAVFITAGIALAMWLV